MSGYVLYLGCIAPLRYPGIEAATRKLLTKLGIDYIDLEGASCCPAPGVFKSFHRRTWLALAARNLALAQAQHRDIITICNGCFGTLTDANHILRECAQTRTEINQLLQGFGLSYQQGIAVRHLAELIYREIGLDRLRDLVVRRFDGLRAAPFYGCHFLKPSKIKQLEHPETPQMLDQLIMITGAEALNYRNKLLCCGSGGGVRARTPEIANKMGQMVLDGIQEAHADCIVDLCPFCHLQFDAMQVKAQNPIPVLHISQFLGLAMGFSWEELGIHLNISPTHSLRPKLGL